MLIVVSMLSVPTIFYRPKGTRDQPASACKYSLVRQSVSVLPGAKHSPWGSGCRCPAVVGLRWLLNIAHSSLDVVATAT